MLQSTFYQQSLLEVDPDEIYLPVGQTFRLTTSGGSGEVTPEAAPNLVTFRDGVLTGTAAGSRDLMLTDAFTGERATIHLTVVPVQRAQVRRAGNGFFYAKAVGPGDIDGDGRPDAIFALSDHDHSANTGGAVVIYRGAVDGLQATPARVIGGQSRGEELGRGIAVADLDNDGLPELLIGAPRADMNGVDSGAVRIYRGVAGGFYSDQPVKTLSGRFSSDLFGSAVAVGDFNGDDLPDLAISARAAEDRSRMPVVNDQGAIHVFLQRASGFRDEPDQSLWGDVPETAGFVGRAGMLLGFELAVGDLDGDGATDIAASSIDFDRDVLLNTNDGLVYVWKGVHAAGTARGGVSALPVLGWASTSTIDPGAAFGRGLTIGELSGDDRAELVMLAPLADNGGGDNYGTIRIARGAPFPDQPITRLAPASAVDWSYAHSGDQDQFGYQAVIADVTGDSIPDLIAGAVRDEVMGGPDGAGTVVMFPGQSAQLPTTTPARVVGGLAAGDSFGAALAVIGDLGGDGVPELLVFATTADTFGRDVGATYTLDGRLDRPPVTLELPGRPAGQEMGRGADLVGDLDGDGFADLVVGAPRDNSDVLGLTTGTAYFYRGSASGFAADPAVVWREFPGHGSGDLFGHAVSRAGDFDGDGRADVAIVARNDDRPATFAAADFAPDPSCTGLPASGDVGAVHVFRGNAGLPAARPSFTVFGVEGGDLIEGVYGGFDYDGDGLDDLLIASIGWDFGIVNNTGGFALVRGRAASPDGKTRVICALDYVLHPAEGGTSLGRALTSLGDLDGDGCDDLAIGAGTEDLGNLDQGTVRILYGFGGSCTAGPRMATLAGGIRSAQAGIAIASDGRDVDGDSIGDLLIGVPAYVASGNAVGAARLISGAVIRALATEAPVDGVAPTLSTMMTGALVAGTTPGGRFGQSVALDDTGAWVGVPLGDPSGTILGGGAIRYSYSAAGGFVRRGVMGGETARDLGRIGETVMTMRGSRAVLVTGYDGQGSGGVDVGSSYVFFAR